MTPGRRLALATLTLLWLGVPSAAQARDLFEEGDFRLSLRSAFKSSLLLAFPPDDPILYPERPAGAGLFRLRFELSAHLGEHVTTAIAYEHRVRMQSGSTVGGGLLPSVAPVAFRLDQLDWSIVDDAPGYLHQHEIDRAYVALHFDFMELTVGRQALGLGRGVLFSAVDVFSPFSPTEVDREWRRGVDSAHLELRIPGFDALSAAVFAALGQASASGGVSTWAVLGRLRAVIGDLDAEVILGRRGSDNMGGLSFSATVGDAEIHGEGALFGTDGLGVDHGFLGTRAVVAKGLLGASYNIDVGTGLRVVLEYHYSGFGAADVAHAPGILADPFFQARLMRGDSQILGQHALALALSYDLFEDLAGTLAYIQSPVDGSGMVAGTFVWTQSDAVTLVLNVFAPWGSAPQDGIPHSEWGASPVTIFVQARFYD